MRNDVRTGKAGETLAEAKLLRWGYRVLDAPQEAPYDLIVDCEGEVIKVQVKTRTTTTGSTWPFRLTRGNWRSATGTYSYTEGDYDILAAVALDIEKVLFVPGVFEKISIPTEEFMRDGSELDSWELALNEVM